MDVSYIIIEHVDKYDVNVLIIKSRGTGKIKTTIIGRVALNVFYQTIKPILIIK